MKWEYYIMKQPMTFKSLALRVNIDDLSLNMNKLGNEGWEFAFVLGNSTGMETDPEIAVVFKRPKLESKLSMDKGDQTNFKNSYGL